ncbi:MAG: hypothetical protein V4505_18970 [Pseudomonadota bacterium]
MNVGDLTESMTKRYGPFMSGRDLMTSLGFRNHASFARARRQGLIEVTLFDLPGRRGPFAWTHEVADWMIGLPSKTNHRSELANQTADTLHADAEGAAMA